MWPKNPETENLLRQAKDGDASAVNQLMDRHRDSLNHLVRMRLDNKIRNRIDVSDVVQDILVEANRRMQRYLESPVMPFHLWLRNIAKDRIIDAYRRHRVSEKRSVDREEAVVLPASHDQSSVQLAALLNDSEITPAAAAMRQEMVKIVESAIARLNQKDAEIIVMRHYEHLTNQEVGRLLEVSEAAASMRYLRAMRRLKEMIESSNTNN